MTHPSRSKGNRFETQCVEELRERGIYARKVPLSGSLGGEYQHDLYLGPDKSETVECKHYKRWLGRFYGWLAAGPRYLFVKEDAGDTLVIMPLAEFARLVRNQDDWSV